ncbi:hypothetical protein ACFXTO_036605 [Malus domestica]
MLSSDTRICAIAEIWNEIAAVSGAESFMTTSKETTARMRTSSGPIIVKATVLSVVSKTQSMFVTVWKLNIKKA